MELTSSRYTNKMQLGIIGLNICLSAFLLFQIQPILAKIILPWFGGSGSVWTVCMLFYQCFLLLGYLLAHLLSKVPLKHQPTLYSIGLIITALTLGIYPTNEWKPTPDDNPTLSIFLLLICHISLPYTILAMTSPLLQSWHSKTSKTDLPYQLYALSNFGSLVALISYPFLIEPNFSRTTQVSVWSTLFYFAIISGLIGAFFTQLSIKHQACETKDTQLKTTEQPPSRNNQILWLILSASASTLLIATTNIMCSEIASNPFLWILTLALYLLSFIFCFANEKIYTRFKTTYLFLFIISSAWLFTNNTSLAEIFFFGCLTVISGCMICHGELVKSKPSITFLTKFYLTISFGGACGGIFVGIIAPLIFTTYLEMQLICLLIVIIFYKIPIKNIFENNGMRRKYMPKYIIILVFLWHTAHSIISEYSANSRIGRNFYGVLKIQEFNKENPAKAVRAQINGRTVHGTQHLLPEKEQDLTSYYGPSSGIGLAVNNLLKKNAKAGFIGLGAGVVAALGRDGDNFTFYEINPLCINQALNNFSFIKNSKANISIIEGDARLNLENSAPQNFDLLLVDAFSSDSIPTHLATAEAFSLYKSHLSEDGILLFHISNRNVNLKPLIFQYAEDHQLNANLIDTRKDPEKSLLRSLYIIVTKKDLIIEDKIPASQNYIIKTSNVFPQRIRWTDDFSDLYSIMTIESPFAND